MYANEFKTKDKKSPEKKITELQYIRKFAKHKPWKFPS